MAEGGVYEDEPESQPQSQSQPRNSAQQLKLNQPYNWNESELEQFVQEGLLRRDDTTLEHLALHPFWLSNPLNGAKEELESFLGKWRPSMNGYLVAVKNIRLVKRKSSRHPNVGFMYQDQPWIHIDACATFYLYTPTVGQKLTGTIMKSGAKAVICVLLKCFSVSVIPHTEGELKNWSVGDDLPFEITFAQNRRRGPIIRATSTAPSVRSTCLDQTFEDWTLDDRSGNADSVVHHKTSATRHKRFSDVDEAAYQVSELMDESTPKKKKKKHRDKHSDTHIISGDDQFIKATVAESTELDDQPVKLSRKHKHKNINIEEPVLSACDDEPVGKKKRHKMNHELSDAFLDPADQSDYKSSKKHRKHSKEVLENMLDNSDDYSVKKKKKKKH